MSSEAISPEDLEQELRQMIEAAKQFPADSPGRKKLINRIIYKMQKSGQIKTKCPSSMWNSGLFNANQQTYEDALQQTWVWFGKKCCEYEPAQTKNPESASVIKWFLHHLSLNKRNPDTNWINSVRMTENPVVTNEEGVPTDKIDQLPDESGGDPDSELEKRDLINTQRRCIESCGVLRRRIISEHPHINCQMLLLLRLPEWDDEAKEWIPEKSWEELEEKFGVPKQKLITCYNRHLTNGTCRSCLQNCLRDW